MPLIEHNIYSDTSETGIWLIEESEEDFLAGLELSEEEQKILDKIAFKTRRLQWLGVRYLIHQMSGRVVRGSILKSNEGKPRLEDSKFYISFSHSEQYVAAAAAPYPVGVDIQQKTDKMLRILHRFANAEELKACREQGDLALPHLIWGAKECMFKAYGKGQINFREHLSIEMPQAIDAKAKTGRFIGKMLKNELIMPFEFLFQQTKDWVFVYGKNVN